MSNFSISSAHEEKIKPAITPNLLKATSNHQVRLSEKPELANSSPGKYTSNSLLNTSVDPRGISSTVLSNESLTLRNSSRGSRGREISFDRKNRSFIYSSGKRGLLEDLSIEEQLLMMEVLSRSKSAKDPFHKSINTLKKLPFIESPLSKLKLFFETLSSIIEEIRDYYCEVSLKRYQCFFDLDIQIIKTIFIYVVIKAKMTSLLVQLKIVKNFVASAALLESDKIYFIIQGVIDYLNEQHTGS